MSVTPGRPPTSPRPSTPLPLWNRDSVIAVLAVAGIAAHLATRALTAPPLAQTLPLAVVFGADLLAGVSILTSVVLGEHLAGALVVLMLSGGEALEPLRRGRVAAGSRRDTAQSGHGPPE